jgi:hypothetical protein
MKVNNTSFYMGDGVFGTSNTSERSNNNPSKSSGISINGSSFALQNDPIAAKREEARKKAMKIIGDAFANDRKIDEDLDESIQWDWGSSDNPETTEHIDEYKSRLRHYRVSRIVFQVSVGALLLNRVVSMLNTIRIYRATSSKAFTERMEFVPEFYEDGSGLMLNVKF